MAKILAVPFPDDLLNCSPSLPTGLGRRPEQRERQAMMGSLKPP